MSAEKLIAQNSLPTAADFGKVGLLLGGWSAEREVSLNGGRAVYEALRRQGVNVQAIDVTKDVYSDIAGQGYDRIFNMVHGRGGEDGVLQSLFEILNLPYTGSGVLGSALTMDKLRTKQIWLALGIPTPEFVLLKSEADCSTALKQLGLPMIVKPILEGSSIGMSKVEQADQLVPAWQTAQQYGEVIVERWISGAEYTVSILQDQVLPFIRLETQRKFYDYQAKYIDNDTKYFCPCGLDVNDEKKYAELALTAFKATGAQGWGRVDFMMDTQHKPWMIEVNTVPGMTDHSLVPMAAKQAGIGFDELVMRILATSFNCHKEQVHGA